MLHDWNFKKNEPKPKCPNFEQIQKIILGKKLVRHLLVELPGLLGVEVNTGYIQLL